MGFQAAKLLDTVEVHIILIEKTKGVGWFTGLMGGVVKDMFVHINRMP